MPPFLRLHDREGRKMTAEQKREVVTLGVILKTAEGIALKTAVMESIKALQEKQEEEALADDGDIGSTYCVH